jgi:hypothetical protein
MAILNELPNDAEVFDLDAARVARAETRKGGSFIKLTAGYIEVHAEIPLEAAELFGKNDLNGGLSLVVVDPEDAAALLADGLTASDLRDIIQFITGSSLGE